MSNTLIILTNHATLGPDNEPNGTYSPELTHAIHAFNKGGVQWALTSPKGGVAPVYGRDAEDAIDAGVWADPAFRAAISDTTPFGHIDVADYDAIFYPGGFGLLYDLVKDQTIANAAAAHFDAGKPIGAVCHGPAGLLPIKLANGKPLLQGRTVAGFTREEEIAYGTIDKIPMLLETALLDAAKTVQKTAPWAVNVVVDGLLVTGQNPASAAGVAERLCAMLTTRKAA